MAQIETWLKQDIKQLVSVVPLRGNIFSGDNDGNLIGVEVFEDGQPYNMTGNCYGYVIKADNQTEFVPGTVSGNKAQIVLPSVCYNVVGPVSIVIKTGVTVTNNVPHGGVTIAACTSYVYRSQTDVVDDATNHILPSYNELADKLADLEAKLIEAGRVNITQNKSGNVITVTTTDRNGTVVSKTLQEPTVSVTPHDGDFDLNVTDANGSQTVTIPNPNKELSDRAHVETVSRSKTRTGNPIVIEDAVAEIADKTVITLEPKQDLHGYDKPWVGGMGKNLLPTTLELLKNRHTSGTWNGNVYSYQGIDYTVLTDSNNNVIGISASGTATANGSMSIVAGTLPAGTYIVNGCPEGGSGTTYRINVLNPSSSSIGMDLGSGVTFTLSEETAVRVYCDLWNGCVASNLVFRPMLCLATETDLTFEPYQNICPITGYDTVEVTRTGKNLFDGILEQGSIDSSTGEKSTVSQAKRVRTANMTSLKKGTYTINGVGVQKCYSYRYTEDGSYDGRIGSFADLPFTFTVDADCKAMFTLYKADGSNFTIADVSSVTIVETASYPIAVSLAEDSNHNPAGTVYSGTVTVNADGSGTVVVDSFFKSFTGSENWGWASGTNPMLRTATDENGERYPASLAKNLTDVIDHPELARCNCCEPNALTTTNNVLGFTVYHSGTYTYPFIQLRVPACANFTSTEDAKAYVTAQYEAGTPIQIWYKIETPITYELTANQIQTLLGYNYIYTDGAEIALTYRQQSLASNDTLLGLLPTGTATGNPATFNDGAEGVPLKNLTVNIEPDQDTHGYGKAWIGGAGKNLVKLKTEQTSSQGVYATYYSDRVELSGATTSNQSNQEISDKIYYEQAGLSAGDQIFAIGTPEGGSKTTYCLRFICRTSDGTAVYCQGKTTALNDVPVEGEVYTLPETAEYIQIYAHVDPNIDATGKVIRPMIAKSSVAIPFEPYENVCPISGWNKLDLIRTKKNMLKNTASSGTVSGVAVTVNEDGTVKLNGTASADGSIVIASNVPIESGKKYALSGCPEGGDSLFTYWLQFTSFYGGITYYVNDDGYGGLINNLPYNMKATVSIEFKSGTSFSNVTFSPMLYPYFDKAEEYEQYSEKIYTVDIPSEAGTVYSGTLTLDQNGEGTLTVDSKIYTVTGSETDYGINKTDANKLLIYFKIPDVKLGQTETIVVADKGSPLTADTHFLQEGISVSGRSGVSGIAFGIPWSLLSVTASDANADIIAGGKAWLVDNQFTVVYRLLTPTTYTLTAEQVKTLLGTNHISCDAGSLDLTYYADINTRINNILSQINDGTGVSF